MIQKKFSVAISQALLDDARRLVKHTPGVTLASLARDGLLMALAQYPTPHGRNVRLKQGRKKAVYPAQLIVTHCTCGSNHCDKYGFREGLFFQGCGFPRALALEIARRYNAFTL